MIIFAGLILLANTATTNTLTTQSEVLKEQPRNQQWIYRESLGDGSPYPRAIFLSWDYSSVIFNIECQHNVAEKSAADINGGFTIYYHYDSSNDDSDFPPITLKRGDSVISSAVTVEGDIIYSNFPITTKTLEILEPTDFELEIEARNEMGEPWYVGNAKPFYQLAIACQNK